VSGNDSSGTFAVLLLLHFQSMNADLFYSNEYNSHSFKQMTDKYASLHSCIHTHTLYVFVIS